MTRRVILALGAALGLTLAGCAELPPINSGECGNGVVDPNEDCDLFADPALGGGTSCALPADSARACRYVCSMTQPCPTGWGCGPDGICRFASGSYAESPDSPMSLTGDHITTGDSDGDDFPDLVGVSSSRIDILYGTDEGTFPDEYGTGIDFPQGPPGFGDLDEDGRLDVVLPLTAGLFVMLGGSDRALAPVAYSPFEIPAPGGGVQVLPIRSQGLLGDNVMVMTANPAGDFCMQYFEEGFENECPPGNGCCFPRRQLPVAHQITELAGRVPVADIDLAQGAAGSLDPSEELALAFGGENRVWIYAASQTVTGRPTTTLRDTVTLPIGRPVLFGARFAYVDSDAYMDLMISVGSSGDDAVAVAYGDGAGGFGTPIIEPFFDELVGGVVTPMSPEGFGQRWPIGVGDVNQDGWADYVNANGVFLRNATGMVCGFGELCQSAYRTTPDAWVEAEVFDFNRDGFADVAAIGEFTPGVDFLVGSGFGLFNRYHVDTDDAPFGLRVGDFDGDLVGDLAFGQHGAFNGAPVDSLAVMYGQLQGAPGTAVAMGRLQLIEYMEPALVIFDSTTLDVTSDLIVQSFASYENREQRSLALMMGSSQRRMLSPFALPVPGQGFSDIPQAVLIGRFDPGDTIPDILAVAPPRLWVVRGAGAAQFNAQDAKAVELTALSDGSFEAYCALWAVGDVDANGTDEVVAVDNSNRCYGSSAPPARILVGAATESGITTTIVADTSGLAAPNEARLADLDGDSLPELIVVFAGDSFGPMAGGGGPGLGMPEHAGTLVYWNNAGTFDVANPSLLPALTDVFSLTSAVNVNADDDKERELALLTSNGVYISNFDPATKAFDAPAAPVLFTFGAAQIFSDDVNADGLGDLIFSEGGPNGLRVFLARPHLDLGGNEVVLP